MMTRSEWGWVLAAALVGCGGESRDAATPTASPESPAATSATAAATTAPAVSASAVGSAAPAEGAGGQGSAAALPTVPLLTAEIIRDVVRPQYADIATCYQEGLTRDPKLAGTVEVALTIAGDGSVVDARQKDIPKARRKQPGRHADDPITDRAVVDCVLAKFEALRFPPSRRGMMQTVYPIVFATE